MSHLEKTDSMSPAEGVEAGHDFDVIVVGAGISGINSGYRLQTEVPNKTYTILEARGDLGGTWDFFKYPGIRSDSDLHTFGFPWRPWYSSTTIADGPTIKKYLKESAEEFGIDKKIRYHHKLLSANWSSKAQRWTLCVDVSGEKQVFTAGFVMFSTGYYNYSQPLETTIPGIENFKGTVVHPQFWPEDLDYTGKRVVIIGSGATAVTLLPTLAQKAEKVTMLQRSPSYVVALPGSDTADKILKYILPAWLAQQITRIKFLALPFLFFKFCRAFPRAAKRVMWRMTSARLPPNIPWDPHFNPSYYPWEQRLCVSPDADFFKALRDGKADVVTGTIDTVREHEIAVNGQEEPVPADIVVTATGLKIQVVGGAAITVDGESAKPGDKFFWNGLMLQDLPNATFLLGYTMSSWTLGADVSSLFTTRILKHMDQHGYAVAVPRLGEEEARAMVPQPTMNLNSTYLKRAQGEIPKAGDRAPWAARSSYWSDLWNVKFGSITDGMEYMREGVKL